MAWLGKPDQAGRLGIQQAAAEGDGAPSGEKQLVLFGDEREAVEPCWVEVNAAAARVESCRQFGGPWLALELVRRLKCQWARKTSHVGARQN